jgi:hypothetical protein
MSITTPSFSHAYPGFARYAGQQNSSYRLLHLVLLSLTLHLIALNYFTNIKFHLSSTKPVNTSTPISVLIQGAESSLHSPNNREIESLPDTIQSELVESVISIPAEKENRNLSFRTPVLNDKTATSHPELAVGNKVRPEANELIKSSKQTAKGLASDMESLVAPTEVFDQRFREKLESARRIQNSQETQEINLSDIEGISYDSTGEAIIISGGNCFRIPGIFFFDTFKELNSIIAMPDKSCSKQDTKTFSLTK